MDFKKLKEFDKRWNIKSTETDEESFKKFKQRIINIMESVDSGYSTGIDNMVTEDSIFDFCQYYGIKEKKQSSYNKFTIIDRLYNESNKKEFYKLIVAILSLDIAAFNSFLAEKVNVYLKNKVKEAIEMSDVNVAVRENTQGGLILYPKGEKKLDEELVNKTLLFLDDKSNKHFEEALKAYQSKEPAQSAESLRHSLEEFLRHKLQNKKGLEINIKILRQGLKEEGSPTEILNIAHKTFEIFNCLDKYFNEHSKHGSRDIPEPENEFLIYQTGLLLRYINTFDLKQKSKSSD